MDITKLTMAEISKVEDLSGVSISAFGDESKPKGKMLAALAYVSKKRQDKDFKFEQALELTMDEITQILGLDEDDSDADPNA